MRIHMMKAGVCIECGLHLSKLPKGDKWVGYQEAGDRDLAVANGFHRCVAPAKPANVVDFIAALKAKSEADYQIDPEKVEYLRGCMITTFILVAKSYAYPLSPEEDANLEKLMAAFAEMDPKVWDKLSEVKEKIKEFINFFMRDGE